MSVAGTAIVPSPLRLTRVFIVLSLRQQRRSNPSRLNLTPTGGNGWKHHHFLKTGIPDDTAQDGNDLILRLLFIGP